MTPITQTLKLDHCWVCEEKFSAQINVEHHHVVPRSYGGSNGPTVSLCGNCHTNLHKGAEKLFAGESPYYRYSDNAALERCLYLSTVVCNARLSVENSENKRYVYSGAFDGKTHDKLVRLSKHFKLPQRKLLKFAIDELYRRTFL